MSDRIYAPNVHLFASYPRQALIVGEKTVKHTPESLEKKYKEILEQFGINEAIALRQDNDTNSSRYLLQQPDNKVKQFQRIPAKGEITTQQGLEITGLAYPLQIGDSYALTLNLRIPQKKDRDELEISRLKEFNPKKCFSPNFINSELGQTLLITAFAGDVPNKELADRYLMAFLQLENSQECPPFYQSGYLFDSPIFEYGFPKQINPYGHILILFFSSEDASKKLNKCYLELPELLLQRHKILTAYQQSRADYQSLYNKLEEIEEAIGGFKKKYLPTVSDRPNPRRSPEAEILADINLDDLKIKLKNLLKIALEYSELLRNLEFYRNTIAINTNNYKIKLKQIQLLSQDDASFFKTFVQQEPRNLQEQIKADLNYFVHDSSLLDKAIDTIRGLVEIEKAERDRQLQIAVFTVGTAISAGGIFATSYALRSATNPIIIPVETLRATSLLPKLPKPLHPVTKSISYSILFGLLAAGLAFLIARIIFPRRRKKAQSQTSLPSRQSPDISSISQQQQKQRSP